MFFELPSFLHTATGLAASALLLAAIAIALWRVITGPTIFDRIVALDLISGVCLCVMILCAILFNQQVFLDAAFAIALIAFLGTVAFARFLEKGDHR